MVQKSHVWLFEGAEGGKWLQRLERELGIMDIGGSDGGVGSASVSSMGDETRSPTPQVNVDNGEGGERRETKKQRVV